MIKHNLTPENPVILIMDNEQSKNKPLSKFLKSIEHYASKVDPNYRETLNTTMFFKIIGNLYLLITPKVEKLKDSEIEDLFDQEVLSKKISGKSFNRNSNSNKNYYGKEIFSKYILDNYHSIDFINFIPMLDSLNSVISDYKS